MIPKLLDEIAVYAQSLEIPKEDIAPGIAEGKHGVLVRHKMQLEAHKKLDTAVGSLEVEYPRVLSRTLRGDSRDEG
jgi:hypothetical protein